MKKKEARPFVFVLMPFSADFHDIYEDTIRRAIEDPPLSLVCRRADEIPGNQPFIEDIKTSIAAAAAVVADLTGRNPNVLYETGIAHQAGKEVIMLTQSMDDVPSDLRHIRCIPYKYTPRGAEQLKQTLIENIQAAMQRAKARPKTSLVPTINPDEEPEPVSSQSPRVATRIDLMVAHEFQSTRYGMAYDYYRTTCNIDSTGAATYTREMALRAYAQVEGITYYLVLPEYPRDVRELLGRVSFQAEDTRHEVNAAIVQEEASGFLTHQVTIIPPLEPGEVLRLRSCEKAGLPLYAFRKDRSRKMDWDYFAWDMSRPTMRLDMTVVFPPGFRPVRPGHDVWYALGLSMSQNREEYSRVQDDLRMYEEGEVAILKLAVDYPVFGLTYVLRWHLPE